MTVVLSGSREASCRRIAVDPDKCVGCRICEMICSLRNYGECNPARARISVIRTEESGSVSTVPVLCQQCEQALCMELCPANALCRSPLTHAVVVDHERCLGCRTCVEVCPLGGPSVDPRTGRSEKCTLCDGDPMCVKACPEGALAFVEADEEALHRRRAAAGTLVEYLRLTAAPPTSDSDANVTGGDR